MPIDRLTRLTELKTILDPILSTSLHDLDHSDDTPELNNLILVKRSSDRELELRLTSTEPEITDAFRELCDRVGIVYERKKSGCGRDMMRFPIVAIFDITEEQLSPLKTDATAKSFFEGKVAERKAEKFQEIEKCRAECKRKAEAFRKAQEERKAAIEAQRSAEGPLDETTSEDTAETKKLY